MLPPVLFVKIKSPFLSESTTAPETLIKLLDCEIFALVEETEATEFVCEERIPTTISETTTTTAIITKYSIVPCALLPIANYSKQYCI
jgi:hypothetical protein